MAYQTWTKEQDSILRDLVEKCLKASEIAIQLDVTRNAVIGRMYRLGLPCQWRVKETLSLEERRRRKAEYERKYRASLGGVHAIRAQRKAEAYAIMRNQIVCCESPKVIWDLTWCDCRWLITDDESINDRLFCANVIEPNKSYCSAHARMAHDVSPSKFADSPNRWTVSHSWKKQGLGRAA